MNDIFATSPGLPTLPASPGSPPHSWMTCCRVLVTFVMLWAVDTRAWAEEVVDDDLRDYLKVVIADSSSFVDRYEAEVFLVSKSEPLEKFIKDPRERLELLRKVHYHATQAGVRPEWVLAVIEIESRFDPYAISRVGAQGIMQVMPFWTNEIGRPDDNLINVDTNLRYGCIILKYYLDRSEGRMHEALARYNGSYGQYWYPSLVMNAWEKHWR